jgi:TolA-binding protein
MRFNIVFLGVIVCSSALFSSEPSVFGAGDLNNPNPYGLTHEEKLILDNKKEIEGIAQKNSLQSAKVETVSERLDGMQAIIEGLGQNVHEQGLALQKMGDANQTGSWDELNARSNANKENIVKLKTLLDELSKVVDEINTQYVTKEEFSALIKQLKVSPVFVAKSETKPTKMDGASVEKKAKALFAEKKYADAQAMYELMVEQKYKVPEGKFWIGESLFEQKNYKEAMGYYKESAANSNKASYMPTLLLHAGISKEKMGESDNAKAFYKTTISKYPSSGAAAEAQKYLDKLQ